LIEFSKPQIENLPLRSDLGSPKPKVDILRLDKIHPLVSGNKWYKLKYNLEHARELGYQRVLSCGGPHSNHLHALACAGKVLGFSTLAFVRGYAHLPLTETLLECQDMGMELIFVDKKTYVNRYDSLWCEQQAALHTSYWVPEGGNNELGIKGCAEIAQHCEGYDEVWMSIGSGCTFTGLAQNLMGGLSNEYVANSAKLKGVMVIKGGEALAASLLSGYENQCTINCDSHLGGFGKCPEELITLIKYYDTQGLPLDPVYTAKLVMAFENEWRSGQLDHTKRYLLIHSGGLQGRRGVKALSENLP
jgi:1-aminocyclopropane-1-carboxylate deaminase